MARYYGVLGADGPRVVSAASGATTLAPGAIASIFGNNLAPITESARVQPPPELLAGVRVSVRDSSGVARPASLYFVSPNQINFVMPAGMSAGAASITMQATGRTIEASAEIAIVAPALFSADATGRGAAAATGIQLTAGTSAAVVIFSCAGSSCRTVPIPLADDRPVYLSLYGSGIRNRLSLANVTCTIGGVSVPLLYAGAQPEFAGLDQVNLALPSVLRGVGEVDVILMVDGQTSNAVRISVQ
jgi:uncharacterized protein (TIGR03437 family)